MSVFSEFRAFIARGNVVDLAVGVIIGAAFGKIVTSLVEQVVMPPIGLLIGAVDFSDLKVVLKPADAATKTAEVAIGYGAFVNTIIQFLIVAFAVFLLVKLVNSLRKAEAAAPDQHHAKPCGDGDQHIRSQIHRLAKSAYGQQGGVRLHRGRIDAHQHDEQAHGDEQHLHEGCIETVDRIAGRCLGQPFPHCA